MLKYNNNKCVINLQHLTEDRGHCGQVISPSESYRPADKYINIFTPWGKWTVRGKTPDR